MTTNQSRISHFQLVVDDSQATPLEKEIARLYWSLEDNGAWSHKTTDIQEILDLPQQVSAAAAIRGAVRAVIPGLCCPACGELLLLRDRNHFNPILRKLILGHSPKDISSTCASCAAAEAARQAKQEEEERRAQLAPQREALLKYDEAHSIDHRSLSSKHAFMTRALVYAFGGSYATRRIPSWFSASKPPLLRSKDEIIDCIKELFSAGVVVPDPDGPLDYVSLNEDGSFTFDVLKTGLLIAKSTQGTNDHIDDDLFEAATDGGPGESFHEYFLMAALSEMKDYFLYLHERYGYRSEGITEKVQNELIKLVETMSVGQAMSVIYISMNRLASKVSDREYHPKHVANMIPGSFQMTVEIYKRNGWEIKPFSMKKDACLSLRYLFGELFSESYYETWGEARQEDAAAKGNESQTTQQTKSSEEHQ